MNGTLTRNLRIFEWGTGGSTLYFGKRVDAQWGMSPKSYAPAPTVGTNLIEG